MTGLINGGAGSNTLQRSNTTGTNEWIMTAQHQGTLNGDSFSNIQTLIGADNIVDTLSGINQNNDWLINGTDSGTLAESIASPSIPLFSLEWKI